MVAKFLPGQFVEVIDVGASYTSYIKMAEWIGLKNYVQRCPILNGKYKVINSQLHENQDAIVVGITDKTGDYLIGERGLNLVSKFQIGDIITNGNIRLTVSTLEPLVNENEWTLISRKKLL